MVEQKVLEDFVQGLKPEQKDTNTVHTAIVSNIDDEGVVWVNINGSDKETPTELVATEVKRGDAVTVQWRNNKLYVASNYTNPSAGVVRVSAVEAAAQTAQSAANNAVADAGRAKEAAEDAIATAESVHSIAQQAAEDAAEAKTSATNASEYASRALGNLSTVQSVTETLNWITAHGTMTLTSDTALDPSHVYFVRNNDGDYVVGGNHYSVVTEPSVDNVSTYYELTIDESLNNYVGTHLSVTSEGLWLLPDAGGNKVLIATGQGQTYTSAGTYIVGKVNGVDTVLASFLASGVQIGQDSESHLNMDYHSMQLIDKEGNAYFHVSDLRSNHAAADEYGEGFYAVVTDTFTGDGSLISFLLSSISLTNNYKVYVNGVEESNVSKNGASFRFATAPADGSIITATYPTDDQTIKAYTAGLRKNGGSIGVMSFAEGIRTTASGNNSHAEGYQTTASGSASHTEGIATTASGDYVHAEGRLTTASGDCAHAEGHYTTASGRASHAEGYYNTASGTGSHAEGSHTTAIGSGSHAEGELTTASGMDSHVQNFRTIAGYNYQTAIGKYNDNQGTSAFEIGNGTADDARSNALTVDWQGNVKTAGSVTENNGTRDIDLQISETTIQKYVDLGMNLT